MPRPELISHIRAGKLRALAITSAERSAALRAPALVEQFAKVAGVASPGSPEDYAKFLAAEQAKWSDVVSAIGFKQQN